LVLLTALGVQFISGASPDRRQLAPSVVPQSLGRTLVVTSTADSGPGTLRQALLDAQSGDTITFDPAVFTPTSPVTITFTSGLPDISQGDLTIDASNAGVILDGSNVGTTPETLLLDDVSLTLDGGPNLIANGNFSAGLGHWRPWDEGSGATRSLNSSDYHSSPNSYAWSTVAHTGQGYTVYDTTNTSAAVGHWPYDSPYYVGSTIWITVTGGSTAQLRFWYRYGPVSARLRALFTDGHEEQIGDWWFDRAADWTEAVVSQALPADAVGVALEFEHNHSEFWTNGLLITSNGNTVHGLQIIRFPNAGVGLHSGAQNNVIGGDRGIGTGPLGQGNLISGVGSFGVGVWDQDTSFNMIVGNYIGTNLEGTPMWGIRRDGVHMNGPTYNTLSDNLIIGSRGNGISIFGDASDNTIGPDNVIAYNCGQGIGVYNQNSLRNTITQNSIHDNDGIGIDLGNGGNTELAAPITLDFDLHAGTVTGWACANCTVEIFSDSSDEGGVYEGGTTANSADAFTLNKGASFAGPHLTATATDADGNTSEFSVPVSGTGRSLILQEGNNLPKTRLWPKRARELADNRIGHIYSDFWHLQDFPGLLDTEISGLGAKRVRLSINEADGDKVDWSKPEFYVDPSHDGFITGIAEEGITITYRLIFWDKANHPEGWTGITSRFKTEEEIQCYLEFVRFIVRHFKDRVQYFEIWNEPVCPWLPVQYIEVADYINLVRRVIPVIHQEYPEAKITVGSIAGMDNPEGREYLLTVLRSDVMPLADVVTWHPMFGDSPEYRSQYYYEYPSIVQHIKDMASAHGFRGEYMAEELVWRSPDCPWCNPNDPLYSNTVSAKYYARGIVMHLGIDVSVGVAGNSSERLESFSVLQNLCTLMAGARPISLPIEIQSEATNIRSYSFSLPNGDHLIALWTDGIAVDDDPGISATLTIPGFSGQAATGIDVLHSFEQKLMTSSEGDNLVIRNLLVKDYPIILRLAPTHRVFLPIVLKGYAR